MKFHAAVLTVSLLVASFCLVEPSADPAAAAGAAGPTSGPVQPPTPTPIAQPMMPAPGLIKPLVIYCRGGGALLGYNTSPSAKFVVVFSPSFKSVSGVYPPFHNLNPGECGFADTKTHTEPHSLCFQTGSLDQMEYVPVGTGFAVLKTTPSVVGQLIQSKDVYGFAVHVIGGCLMVERYEGPE